MLRTFIAVELAPDIRAALGEVQDTLQARMPPHAVRWVRPASIHLTLKFLGEVTEGEAASVRGMLAEIAPRGHPFSLSVSGLGCFPDARRPRVVWVGIGGDRQALLRLQEAVDGGCEAVGFKRDRRGYQPHLTLGRVREHKAARQIGDAVLQTDVSALGSWQVSEVVLFKSDLRPDGAVHTALARAPLGA